MHIFFRIQNGHLTLKMEMRAGILMKKTRMKYLILTTIQMMLTFLPTWSLFSYSSGKACITYRMLPYQNSWNLRPLPSSGAQWTPVIIRQTIRQLWRPEMRPLPSSGARPHEPLKLLGKQYDGNFHIIHYIIEIHNIYPRKLEDCYPIVYNYKWS